MQQNKPVCFRFGTEAECRDPAQCTRPECPPSPDQRSGGTRAAPPFTSGSTDDAAAVYADADAERRAQCDIIRELIPLAKVRRALAGRGEG